MSSLGNFLGATMGGEYDDSWVTNPNYPERQTLLGPLLGPNGRKKYSEILPQLNPGKDPNAGKYLPKSNQLSQIPGSDDSTYQEVERDLNGPHALNWESKTFVQLRAEKDALQSGLPYVNTLATAWKDHGDTLNKASNTFRSKVRHAISGQWTGSSADAADLATQQVTKTSIYDFTPSSDELSKRLNALSEAFTEIIQGFPPDANAQLTDSGNFDLQQLAQEVAAFNSAYHLDGSGRLRNNSDNKYVECAKVIQRMNQLKLSIKDYQLAVQVFRDIYNPAVEAVTANFPNLPSPPDMTYGSSGGGGGLGGNGGGTNLAGGSGLGGLGTLAGLGTPTSEGIADPVSAATTAADPTTATTSPTSDLSAANDLSALASPLQSLSSPLQSALGQAMNAAQRGNTGALGGVPKMPGEGALALGPNGFKGLKGGAGAVGGGAGPRSSALAKPAGAPASSAGSAAARTVAAGARAGLGTAAGTAGMGAPGAGAPGAGHGGAGGPGGQHQPSKALRRKKNGEQIIGDTQAVVAVLGEPARPEAAKTEAT